MNTRSALTLETIKGLTYYQILGLPSNASDEDINKAYKKLAVQYHPDKNNHPEAEEIFKKISEAHEILSDKDKRSAYDPKWNNDIFDDLDYEFDDLDYEFGYGIYETKAFESAVKSKVSSKTWHKFAGTSDYIQFGNINAIIFPLQRIAKDFRDTFKPYKKASHQVNRDINQWKWGLSHIIAAAIHLAVALIIYPVAMIVNIFTDVNITSQNIPRNNQLKLVKMSASSLGAALILAAWGAVQLATIPVTWFVRIPIRTFLSLLIGQKKIEENTGIKRVHAECETALQNKDGNMLFVTTKVLHMKFQEAKYKKDKESKKQRTEIDAEQESKSFNVLNKKLRQMRRNNIAFDEEIKSTIVNYLSLFQKKAEPAPAKSQPAQPSASPTL